MQGKPFCKLDRDDGKYFAWPSNMKSLTNQKFINLIKDKFCTEGWNTEVIEQPKPTHATFSYKHAFKDIARQWSSFKEQDFTHNICKQD